MTSPQPSAAAAADETLQQWTAEAISGLFPTCPPERAAAIAGHTRPVAAAG